MPDTGTDPAGRATGSGPRYGGLTVFYDGACGICRREINHYRNQDRGRRIDWVEVNRYPDRLAAHAIEYSAAIRRLHVIDADGVIQTGVQAFLSLWSELPGYRQLAGVVRVLRVEWILERAYTHLTRWRLRNRCDLEYPPDQGAARTPLKR